MFGDYRGVVPYKEALPRGPTPYAFVCYFDRKTSPSRIPLIEKGTHFQMLSQVVIIMNISPEKKVSLSFSCGANK